MKTTMKILPLMLGIMLFFTQCEKEASDKGSTFSEDVMTLKSDCESVVQTLWAGAGQNDISKGIDVGTVTATLLAENQLLVEYSITEPGYSLTEVHLWVGKDKSVGVFPRQAAPGRFPYKANLDFGTIQWDTIVDLDFEASDHKIYVSAHGVVVFGETDGVDGLEGLEELLPIDDAVFSIVVPNVNTPRSAYNTLTLTEANSFDGVYDGYCFDPYKSIGTIEYDATLYSSLSDDLPIGLVLDPNFNQVNWVINNIQKFVGDTYNYADIQVAIWELLWEAPIPDDPDNWINRPANAPIINDANPVNVAQIVADAKDNPTYMPGCDDKLVILVVPKESTRQPILIWKDIPCIEFGSETVWAFGEHKFNDPYNFIARKWGWIFEVDCTDE